MRLFAWAGNLPALRESYAAKFALAAFVGVMVPLATFTLWLLASRSDWTTMYPALAALVLACFAGFLGTLWMLRELLVPVELTAEALRTYIETRRLPDLPVGLPDSAGRLMEGTQYTLMQLHATIARLERISDADDLTGVYNARAGEKRLAEEIARAERDLQAFHVALFDIDRLAAVNEKHGHSAGDACVSHVASLLQLNTRRGDWVARGGADEFLVGFHRSRELRVILDRILQAVASTPCEVAAGTELRVSVCCGVAEYRFGSGPQGLASDLQRALFAAKERSRSDGRSHACYRHEFESAPAREHGVPATAP